MSSWVASEGASFSLGATWIEEQGAYNFALYSQHAESVTLLLYKEDDVVNPVFIYPFDALNNKSGRFWHCRIPRKSMSRARYYAYYLAEQQGFGRCLMDEDVYGTRIVSNERYSVKQCPRWKKGPPSNLARSFL